MKTSKWMLGILILMIAVFSMLPLIFPSEVNSSACIVSTSSEYSLSMISSVSSSVSKEEILQEMQIKFYVQNGITETGRKSARAVLGFNESPCMTMLKFKTTLFQETVPIAIKEQNEFPMAYASIKVNEETVSAESMGHDFFIIPAVFENLEVETTYQIQTQVYYDGQCILETEGKTV